jgi:UDP-N-acetylglucosamine--N-acetylmuramyl-(pentapeptide) pyrophosphoryl-undecaprenol N-acetylglucosamine transferase
MIAGQRMLVVLAAGGTGGHMFPAEALARELARRDCGVALITDRRGGGYGDALSQIETHQVRAGQVTGRGIWARLMGLAQLALGTIEARKILRRLRPAAAVGFGGYASVPAMLAATGARIPTVLHEQNAVLGRANRMLAPRVDCIATSFAEVSAIRRQDRAKIVRTGNPVRAEIAALSGGRASAAQADGPLRILVLGGSQGATVFSRVVPEAVAALGEDMRARLEISQQCRSEDLESVERAYAGLGIQVDLSAFFDDVAGRLARADLVICRAGASTVAEITAAGRSAILVPYPRATDDHQTANARAFEDAGGGWMMPESEFTGAALSARIESLLRQPGKLDETAALAGGAGIPDAAARLAEIVLAVARGNGWTPGDAPAWESAA